MSSVRLVFLIDLYIVNEPRPTNGRPENRPNALNRRFSINVNVNKSSKKDTMRNFVTL
jgi:hypothetical protein